MRDSSSAHQREDSMQGVLRATAEKAAAAEEAAHQSSQMVVRLQQQLADLKDRWVGGS